MKLYWVIKVQGQRCIVDHFTKAWDDLLSHDLGTAIIYPKLMSKTKYEALNEFSGW